MSAPLYRRAACLLGLALLMAVVLNQNWDQDIANRLDPWQNQAWVEYWGLLAYWAGLGGVQIAAPALLALWGLYRKQRDLLVSGLLGCGAVLGSGAAVQVVKHLVGRPRPRLDLPVWEYFGPTLQSDLHSFPSGHAATSFALASLISARHPRAAWPAYVLASAICAGRVLSDSHHFSDVLGGAVLGLAVGWPLSRLLAGSAPESS